MSTPTRGASSFASLTPNNLGTVRKLNSVLFPIKYSEKFYQDILLPEVEDFCKLVYYNDVPVGTICCRLENKDGQVSLYLMTMGILAPKIDRIYLHVQTSNTEAKKFYERHGFHEIGVHENYYKKIVPHDAWILEMRLTEKNQ
ncbi:acyl-CoA N-acyltransferase [Mycena epipterygia]|nr:acyl-CoA N-acyltransferase [Mycena epipterygia]